MSDVEPEPQPEEPPAPTPLEGENPPEVETMSVDNSEAGTKSDSGVDVIRFVSVFAGDE